jgi:hypothetical protein
VLVILLACFALACSALPLLMVLRNLPLFQRQPLSEQELADARGVPVSVLIPARNEEGSIDRALAALQLCDHSNFEVLVLDDHSEDATARIVTDVAQRDPRIRLLQSNPLPDDWNGKQHACWQLANAAQHERLLFLDADVRAEPALLATALAELHRSNVVLTSGFPQQETQTWSERVLIPMMHYVLLSYLPIWMMRVNPQTGFAAGCGQLFLARRSEYFEVGGHRAIAASRHDGIQLPKAFRQHGYLTNCFDASDLATCRMYTNRHEVVSGLVKNATEGIARMPLLVIFSILMLGSTFLPIALVVYLAAISSFGMAFWVSVATTIVALTPRAIIALRLRQHWLGPISQPIAIPWFVAIQWWCYIRHHLNLTTPWRGRT